MAIQLVCLRLTVVDLVVVVKPPISREGWWVSFREILVSQPYSNTRLRPHPIRRNAQHPGVARVDVVTGIEHVKEGVSYLLTAKRQLNQNTMKIHNHHGFRESAISL